jgi:hypothetical protein
LYSKDNGMPKSSNISSVLRISLKKNNTFFFLIRGNPTSRKTFFVGPGERVKPRLFQALTRSACPDSNLKPAVQILSLLPSRYASWGQEKQYIVHTWCLKFDSSLRLHTMFCFFDTKTLQSIAIIPHNYFSYFKER